MRIDIWSDIACPWCYIGVTRMIRAVSEFEFALMTEIALHSFQLDPELPESYDGTEAEYLAQRKGMAPEGVEGMFEHVRAAAATEGLTLNFDTLKVANSFKAHRLVHVASQLGAEAALKVELALFKAHFTDGESIADDAVLERIAAENGLKPGSSGLTALDAATHADISLAHELGITSVPFFVFGEKYGFGGAQPREVMDSAIREAWDATRPQSSPEEAGQ